MNLKSKRQLSSRIVGVGFDRVWFDPARLSEIKEAITKTDIRGLISNGVITKKRVLKQLEESISIYDRSGIIEKLESRFADYHGKKHALLSGHSW